MVQNSNNNQNKKSKNPFSFRSSPTNIDNDNRENDSVNMDSGYTGEEPLQRDGLGSANNTRYEDNFSSRSGGGYTGEEPLQRDGLGSPNNTRYEDNFSSQSGGGYTGEEPLQRDDLGSANNTRYEDNFSSRLGGGYTGEEPLQREGLGSPDNTRYEDDSKDSFSGFSSDDREEDVDITTPNDDSVQSANESYFNSFNRDKFDEILSREVKVNGKSRALTLKEKNILEVSRQAALLKAKLYRAEFFEVKNKDLLDQLRFEVQEYVDYILKTTNELSKDSDSKPSDASDDVQEKKSFIDTITEFFFKKK